MERCYTCEKGILERKKVDFMLYGEFIGKFDADVCSKCGEKFFEVETMTEAVYVRFDVNELNFINTLAKEEKITRSEAIKKLVDYAAEKLKVEKALANYKEGKATIRESAESAGLRYFEFFDILAKENLIGTNPENTELLLHQLQTR